VIDTFARRFGVPAGKSLVGYGVKMEERKDKLGHTYCVEKGRGKVDCPDGGPAAGAGQGTPQNQGGRAARRRKRDANDRFVGDAVSGVLSSGLGYWEGGEQAADEIYEDVDAYNRFMRGIGIAHAEVGTAYVTRDRLTELIATMAKYQAESRGRSGGSPNDAERIEQIIGQAKNERSPVERPVITSLNRNATADKALPAAGGKHIAGGGKSLTKASVRAKSMTDHDEDLSLSDGPDGADDGAVEPYGAGVLRRLHEDHSILLDDYDRLHGPLENEAVKKLLAKLMEHKVGHLDEIESTFSKHYKDLPPLAGAGEDEDDLEGGEGEFTEDEEEGDLAEEDEDLLDEDDFGDDLGEDPEDDEYLDDEDDSKDMADLDMAGVGADSDTSRVEDEPSPEDAFHGSVKSIRRRIKNKSISGRAKGHGCRCGGSCPKCRRKKALDQRDYGQEIVGDGGDAETNGRDYGSGERDRDTEDVTHEVEGYGDQEGLQPHEVDHLTEAMAFLEGIGREGSVFGEEDRMKAYHFHKLLDGLAGPIEEEYDPGVAGDELWEGEPGVKSAEVPQKKPANTGSRFIAGVGKLAGAVGRAVTGGRGSDGSEKPSGDKTPIMRKVSRRVGRAATMVRDATDLAAIRAADAVAGGVNKVTAAARKVPGVRRVVPKGEAHAGHVLGSIPGVVEKYRRARGLGGMAGEAADNTANR
jgi:hypothetical protein